METLIFHAKLQKKSKERKGDWQDYSSFILLTTL